MKSNYLIPQYRTDTFKAYRTAHHPLHPPPYESDPRQIYHSLWPLPALSPCPVGGLPSKEQEENEAAYRQLLVQGVLAILLPTEDLENDCLTTLVGQILSEMILGNGVGTKASEPWLLWESITKLAEVIQEQLPKSKARDRAERLNSDLIASRPLELTGGRMKQWRVGKSIQRTFWLVLQYAFVAFSALQFLLISMVTSPSLPSRIAPNAKFTGLSISIQGHTEPSAHANPEVLSDGGRIVTKRPIISMKIWSCVGCLLDLNARMPWLSATISMVQWGALTGPGELGNTDGMIDKYVLRLSILKPFKHFSSSPSAHYYITPHWIHVT